MNRVRPEAAESDHSTGLLPRDMVKKKVLRAGLDHFERRTGFNTRWALTLTPNCQVKDRLQYTVGVNANTQL